MFSRVPQRWVAATCLLAVAGALRAQADDLQRTATLGPVNVTMTLEPARPLVGDPVTLTIKVQAEPDVELLMPEFGEALNRFSIIDFVPRQTLDSRGGMLASQIYRLQPPGSGPQSIPPILIEFVDRRPGKPPSPEDADAYEILTERIDFDVESVLPDSGTADLKPPLGALAPREARQHSRWPWVLGTVVVVMAISVPLLWRGWAAHRRRARRRSAYEIAMGRLHRLLVQPRPDEAQIDRFYVDLSGIIRRYLEDRFDLRAPELTTEEFLATVGQSDALGQEHQSLLREFLRQSDLVKFAGVRPTTEVVERSIETAQKFLEETRENAPLMDVEDDEARFDESRTHEEVAR